jgi:predicted DCC family thiol-disulfide oxidoreductase YuxK
MHDEAGPGRHLLLYDGVCGFCNWLVQVVLANDRGATFDFAALQSDAARRALAPFGASPDDLDTVYVIDSYRAPEAQLLSRGRGALFVFSRLSGPWRLLRVLGVLPSPILDWGYRFIARHRYRIFGRYDTCPLPDPAVRGRFLDSR